MNRLHTYLILIIVFATAGCGGGNSDYYVEPKESIIRTSAIYIKAKSDFESGKVEDAFKAYTKLINDNPEQEWLKIEKGDMYSDVNQYVKALDCYFKITSPEKLNIGARQIDLRIGGIYEKIGKIDSAIYYYNKILQAVPPKVDKLIGYDNDKETAYSRLGEIEFKKTNYNLAVKYLSKSIDIQRIPKALYIRANAYYMIGKHDLAENDYNESIDLIRKIYINKHPYLKDVLCDTCGTFFGKEEYMDVLEEWRDFDNKIKERKETDSLFTSHYIYKTMIDSVPKWNREIEELKSKTDQESIKRRKHLKDSLNKYMDTVIEYNVYD